MTEEIILAAGCFWSVQYKISTLKGVIDTKAIYIGGHVPNPTYEQVCSDATGHAEAVLVTFNSEEISLEELLLFFFNIHDASQYHRQGPDIGSQYRSAIFYFTEAQKNIAEKVKQLAQQSKFYKNLPIVTEISPVNSYYLAEEYHQHYYRKKGL
ncbi:MAG: peptide-methionine (S)-S-oxide reductase MsrA [Bacteroidales bacterium]|nr:peptide-methionine (S)-S-oxide reductase MsrA [Bacteroidales bacterium]